MPSEWIVGRNPESDIRLDSPTVSRRHLKIRARTNGRYEISDLGSSGGTYLQDGGQWRRIETELVDEAAPIMLGQHATSIAELFGQKPPRKAVFLSYASPDRKAAFDIAGYLESRGYSCWIAPRDVRPGRDYGEEIIRGIEGAPSFVLVLSAAANSSTFVKREVERAVSKGKPIFPVRIEEVPPSPALELFISTAQWIDAWSGSMDGHLDRLAGILSHVQGVSPADGGKAGRGRLKRRLRRALPSKRSVRITGAVLAVALVAVLGAYLYRQFAPGMAPATEQASDAVAPGASQTVGGVTVSMSGMSISSDRRTISAGLSITNTNPEPALVMVVGWESSFLLPGTSHKAAVETNGIADCKGRGGYPKTGFCLKYDAMEWSRLEPGQTYSASVYSRLRLTSAVVDAVTSAAVNLRFLVRNGDDSKPFNISFTSAALQ